MSLSMAPPRNLKPKKHDSPKLNMVGQTDFKHTNQQRRDCYVADVLTKPFRTGCVLS
jgi:hypothetical protein